MKTAHKARALGVCIQYRHQARSAFRLSIRFRWWEAVSNWLGRTFGFRRKPAGR